MTDVGSERALLRALYEQHEADVAAYVMGLTGGDRSSSEAVVQETFVRACRHPAMVGQGPESVRAWLFGVAHRVVIDGWRRREDAEQAIARSSRRPRTAHPATPCVNRLLIRVALSRISAAHRQVLVECFLRDASISEAAIRLGLPIDTVKAQCHYALLELRLALDEIDAAL